MVRAFLMMALVVLLAGCYRNVPVRIGSVPPGSDVVVRLTVEGRQHVEELTGLRRVELSGQLLQWAEEITISVPVIVRSGTLDRGLRQPITVRADEVVGVDVRELDRGRTAIVVAGVGAVVGAVLVATVVKVIGGSQGGGQPPGGAPPAQPALLKGFH